MIIVSDTSPINNLATINHLYLLRQLYGTVIIPEAVYRELTDPNFPVAGATEIQPLIGFKLVLLAIAPLSKH
ncbi:MAG: hypothetical protein HC899_31360 [Leptolyngbyaceae cyanobacterium SM1_4_3]|nr:hypothetical protein [Leptolyngbyaceae cyanobacterium SM1_4_3]